MLPFTIDTYFVAIEQYNRAIWPLAFVGYALVLIAIGFVLRPHKHSARAVGVVLVIAWLWSGIGFHLLHFSTLNFAAPAYAGLFLFQAVLMGWACLFRGKLTFRFVPGVPGMVGLTLATIGAVIWPLVGLMFGSGEFTAAPVFGADPTATVLFTLAILLLSEGRAVLWLAIIPVLWTFVDGATFFVLEVPVGLVFPIMGLVVFVLLVLKRRVPRATVQEE